MRYVVWDWNGTLLNDLACAVSATNQLLDEFRLPRLAGVAAYHQVFRFPVRDYYADLGFDVSPEGNFDAASRRFLELYLAAARGCELHDGATQTMAALHSDGIGQVLISASEQTNLTTQVTPFGLDGWLEQALGLSDIYAASKRMLAERWLESTGADPAQVLFVGDSEHDYEIAAGLGARCALYSGGHQSRQHLESFPVPVIDDLRQVAELVRAG
ncbi:phosphoglycolate phosphatase [Propionicimonas paludicola]|uniref:Phosphoglycolate phosphatase n=1 Tax=Propionicimonas paludicola TaxID=185243 RepID=A0A2A9CQG8_9ACTN|nr:HAD hydrolase-like protein [Propionicimonas paludicola]PFG16588.1 phosphoglycolate phosphatase [Propionicimonas paludicola]